MINKCIICRQETLSFSDEHVFPQAIGGVYHIFLICENCNKLLGSTVDSKLLDHITIKLFREQFNLSGKRGDIPSFFEGTFNVVDDNKQKVFIKKDENGESVLKLIERTEPFVDTNGHHKIKITIDKKDINFLPDILKKIEFRLSTKNTKVVFSEPNYQHLNGINICGDIKIDFEKYRICLLKIAYEFVNDLFESYSEDIIGKDISEILKKGKYCDVNKYVLGDGFSPEIINPFQLMFGDFTNKHIAIITYVNSRLFCYVSIFNSMCAVIVLSNNDYCKGKHYCVMNDFILKTVTKFEI